MEKKDSNECTRRCDLNAKSKTAERFSSQGELNAEDLQSQGKVKSEIQALNEISFSDSFNQGEGKV